MSNTNPTLKPGDRFEMTDLTDERLAEIRARLEATTPGDWRAVKFSSVVGCPIMTQPDKTKNSVVIAGVHGAFGDDYRAEVEANAAFIGLGPKTTLALLDALTSTRERAEKAEARVAVLEGLLTEAVEVVEEARNYLPTIPIASEREAFRAKIDALAAKLKAGVGE